MIVVIANYYYDNDEKDLYQLLIDNDNLQSI